MAQPTERRRKIDRSITQRRTILPESDRDQCGGLSLEPDWYVLVVIRVCKEQVDRLTVDVK
jgi:hypothetical protein